MVGTRVISDNNRANNDAMKAMTTRMKMITMTAATMRIHAEANCLQTLCHIELIYGQLKLLPLSNMSLMSVSIGVLPTRRTKNNCSITCELTVLREGNRSRSLPNLVGWLGYCVLQYSSSAHCDFSWRLSMCATSESPHASETNGDWLRTNQLKNDFQQLYDEQLDGRKRSKLPALSGRKKYF